MHKVHPNPVQCLDDLVAQGAGDDETTILLSIQTDHGYFEPLPRSVLQVQSSSFFWWSGLLSHTEEDRRGKLVKQVIIAGVEERAEQECNTGKSNGSRWFDEDLTGW